MSAKRKGRAAPAVATQPTRAIEVATRSGRAYPTAAELVASGALDAIGDALRAVLSGAVLAGATLAATGCGVASRASVPVAPVAMLAPAPPGPGESPKGDALVATLVPLPLPPPPPLPGTTPPDPPAAPPPRHHVRPPVFAHRFGGVMVAPHPTPIATSGGAPVVDF